MTIGERIKLLRTDRGLTLEQLGELVGVGKSTVRKWESGFIANMRRDKIAKLAAALNVSPGYLMGWEGDEESEHWPSNVRPLSALHRQRVPMIGEAAAGEPIYAPEDVGVYVDSPVDADAAITIHGDSMVPTYLDGDIVYIKCRPDVPEGAIAVVFLDDEATIKHVYKRPTGLTLWSDNTAYAPMNIEFEDYTNVRIFGVPVGYTRIYKKGIEGKIKKGFQTEV